MSFVEGLLSGVYVDKVHFNSLSMLHCSFEVTLARFAQEKQGN